MRIIFLGGSITEGLGVARSGKTYANLLKFKMSVKCSQKIEILNFGASAMQINESRMKYESKILELKPELIVFAHGNTEAVVREQRKFLRYLPRRWRRPGWMDPRPYYSTRRLRRWLEKLESGLRWRVKVSIIRIFGGKQWMGVEDFKRHTMEFVQAILKYSPDTKIILLTPGDIEERYFPGSPESMKLYREAIHDVYKSFKSSGRLFMCDSSVKLHKWDDYFMDRFHPNELGHDKIAEALMDTIDDQNVLPDYTQLLEEVAQ
ncbi:hypothetical protein E6C60_3371 [Paenibacillus algicola]|uniref:Uncharacterized protein n=1 Tax=Paenibacillus algicola TaxID=2565926 RepID=A0A4P8XMQ6_9BACL|nr:SGNH/GDSL hydrolase family protein [Paenibacillus algicola]QCT04082.1 hypothetical protein E6C60_3371 [Paenibacillus algicola]